MVVGTEMIGVRQEINNVNEDNMQFLYINIKKRVWHTKIVF